MGAAPKNAVVKKDVISKVAAKKWLWLLAKGKNFNNDDSDEFVLLSPRFTTVQHHIHLNCRY